MSIQVSSNFNLNSSLPLDARTIVADVTARDLIPSIQRYEGMVVYTDATNTNYQLQGGITNGNWIEFGTIPDASYTVRGAVNTTDQTFAGAKTLKGTLTTDRPPYTIVSLGVGTGTNWTGSNFISGYTHTPGSTVALVSSAIANYRDFYSIYWTITGRTAGSVQITFGSQDVYPVGLNPPSKDITASGTSGVRATSSNVFTITPTSDFNGTISFTSDGVVQNASTIRSTSLLNFLQSTRSLGSSYELEFRMNDGYGNFLAGKNAGGHSFFGTMNTGIGYYSLAGGINTLHVNGIGAFSNGFLIGGAGVTSIGGYAGNQIGSGAVVTITAEENNLRYADYSTFIGYDTRAFSNNQTNQIVIGHSVTGLGSNTTSIGNSDTTLTGLYGSLKLLGGYGTGIKTGTATYALQVDSSGNVIEGALPVGGTFGGTDVLATTNRIFNTGNNYFEINNFVTAKMQKTFLMASSGLSYDVASKIEVSSGSVSMVAEDTTDYNLFSSVYTGSTAFPDSSTGIGTYIRSTDYNISKSISLIVQPAKVSIVDHFVGPTTVGVRLNLGPTTEYADNAAALTAGLMIGDVYRTGDLLKIVH